MKRFKEEYFDQYIELVRLRSYEDKWANLTNTLEEIIENEVCRVIRVNSE